MSWPKHNWGWIVFDGWGNPLRDNGEGTFCGGGFGEVFLSRKAADWIANIERTNLRNRLAWNGVPQLFGSGSPNLTRTASGAGLWLREQKAHHVLPLPE